MRKQQSRQRGFTIIELMISLSVIAVLLTVAAPAMKDFFNRQKIKSAGEQLYADLQLARSEAIARNMPVYVNVSADGSSSWSYGISDVNNCNLTVVDPTNAAACTLVVDDGDLSVHGIEGATDTDDKILRRYTSADHPDITLARDGFLSGTQISFDPSNGTAIGSSGSLRLASAAGLQLLVAVTPLGQVHICSPDGSVSGYADAAPGDDSEC